MATYMSQPFQPGVASVPTTKVELSISCRNLQDKDIFSKSDPMCVLFVKESDGEKYHEFGRTEMIKNTLNPDFVKKFVIDYRFEEIQKLKFEIYDIDTTSPRLQTHDFLGKMECTLGEIVSCQGTQFRRNLQGTRYHPSYIIVVSEEVGSCKELAIMQFLAIHLDKKDFFGKSDPFLCFYRCNEDNSYSVVHKTEVIKCTLNPTWKPFTIPVRRLCNGDYDRSIKVECYDWDSDGSHLIMSLEPPAPFLRLVH
ncbi:copine-8-like [Limulus polyphemus]|uniref:Copine-8-like n=1 Tax=Limulus polyphemus TaxID=6850 RepID=A0ABM1BDT9_LIMPO|nr:copine-8-like [Limulus polyphemus]